MDMSGLDELIAFLDSNNISYEKDCELSRHSSFRIGGKADIAVFPDANRAPVLLTALENANMRYTVIGNGTNVLFSDNGYRGVVVFTGRMDEVIVNGCELTAGAGYSLTALASVALKNGLTGLEFAYGIPGSVGGAVYMNAGAYGGEISDVLYESDCFDPQRGIITLRSDEHDFAYRRSVYCDNNFTIISAKFKLREGDREEIREKMNELMRRRKEKQPLDMPSAGSTFKRYPGYFTAALIDEAGLKGYSIGGAAVSEKHAGFVVNTGTATASDVLALIDHIKNKIYEKHNIIIETEVRIIGE